MFSLIVTFPWLIGGTDAGQKENEKTTFKML